MESARVLGHTELVSLQPILSSETPVGHGWATLHHLSGLCHNILAGPGSIMAFRCRHLGEETLKSLDGPSFEVLPVIEQQWKANVGLSINIYCPCHL